MLFMVTYAITQEKLRETQIQFTTQEENWYGMELIGRWHQPSNTGVLILRTDDSGPSQNGHSSRIRRSTWKFSRCMTTRA